MSARAIPRKERTLATAGFADDGDVSGAPRAAQGVRTARNGIIYDTESRAKGPPFSLLELLRLSRRRFQMELKRCSKKLLIAN